MNADKSYYFHFQEEDIKNSPGLFIFLVDQTFALQGEGLINLKDSLKKLLAILPKVSYYQLIGFHTFFTMYNQTPVEYNQKNYLNSIEQIDNMKVERLTNILVPLFEIYLNGRYNHIDLPCFIIMLTDGQLNSTDIGDIICSNVEVICTPEKDKENVAQMMSQNPFNKMPVVDAQHKLKGIITYDEVIDIISEEATEDI